ncbi:MAG: iron-sulfur cluster-binding domain-containing protein [Myxococcota bacterium]|jgi:ferredoxin-NADP reductase|nr:iron-sulfur cluster-binding domain-containing protein [Myxococcota bacterium]
MLSTIERRLSATLRDARRTAARRFFVDRQTGLWRSELAWLGVRSRDHARVTAVLEETPDTRTLVLEPPRGWVPHRPGQWTRVEIELAGVRTSRCYSLSSAPHDPELRITVKRVANGRVSGRLHTLRVGDALRISPAEGQFVLPTHPVRLLLLSGGSGITPMRSMWRALLQSDAADVVIVHHARTRADVIFAAELEALATRRGFRVVVRLDDEHARPGEGGFDVGALRTAVPDLEEREVFVCGPPAMMRRVEAMGLPRLHVERFAAMPRPAADPDATEVLVTLGGHASPGGRTIAARTDGALLDQLEAAGERPASGCRMGLCRTCSCLKRSGTVRHAISGAISDAPDEIIQLCVSVPCTDVELGPIVQHAVHAAPDERASERTLDPREKLARRSAQKVDPR